MQEASSNKRIAINTLMLYVRMIFLLGVSFYTTRVILQVLGVNDLGIYNVVGGVVAMFGFVSGSLSSASSRFITYSLGKKDETDIKTTFNTIVTVHLLLGFVILILAETIGLWFVLNKLVIPCDRINAALWVYQSAVISSVIVVVTTPYNADIIAHEKMSAFAYISIYEALAKLAIVFILSNIACDKLIVYSCLLVMVQCSVISLYIYYCRKHFIESRFRLLWDSQRVKNIFSYTGWVMTGSFAYICCTQGLNIILNLFFGPVVNAARALANQLQGAINQFTTNFQTAVKPQIIKSYAQNDYVRMHSLILASSKFGALLMLMLAAPVFVTTNFLLEIWLGDVPEYTINFVQIMLFVGIISAMKDPTMTAIHATGKIKKVELMEMFCMLSLLPIAYLLLRYFNITPEETMFIYLLVEIGTQLARVWVVYPSIGLRRSRYLSSVLLPIIVSGIVAISTSLCIKTVMNNGVISNVCLIFITEAITIVSIMTFGLSGLERIYLITKIKVLLKNKVK